MELSSFRQKLQSGVLDNERRNRILGELKYFNSIAPKSLIERIRDKFGKNKLKELTGIHKVVLIIGLICLLPIVFFLFAITFQFLIILLLAGVFLGNKRGTPEYKDYNFKDKVALPALKLYDDNLNMTFHYSGRDMVYDDLKFDQALVDAHLVRPLHSKTRSYEYSNCSYDWYNKENTDAFEHLGYKLYHEYTDSEGDTHEDIFFDGIILKFRTSFTIDGIINIMSTTTKKTLVGEREKNRFKKIQDKDFTVIDTENNEFAESFDTLATYDVEAYRFLTPKMIETLLELRKKYYFCICIKENTMTVTINGAYKNIGQSSFDSKKPYSRNTDSDTQFNNMMTRYRSALLSIYELKDLLDPEGKYAG